jgi:tripartite-type tricarboxylate transporter receptor subunit TctC
MTTRRALVLACAVGMAAFGALPARAEWPDRTVTIVVPYPAGGPNDVLARVVGAYLGEQLKQPVVIENKVGAGGNIAAGNVARAKPDGYTLLFTSTGPAANNQFLYSSISFDPAKDFDPIVLVAKSPVAILASKRSGLKTLNDLVVKAKAKPGTLNAGNAGHGTISHIVAEYFQRSTGIKMTNVPYRGSTPVITDLLNGSLDVAFDLVPSHIPLVKAGEYAALAITSLERAKSLPDVPTVAEGGVPGFEASSWSALVAPAGVPKEVVGKVNGLVNAYLRSPEGASALEKLEMTKMGGSPDDMNRFVATEIVKWGKVIKDAKITAN